MELIFLGISNIYNFDGYKFFSFSNNNNLLFILSLIFPIAFSLLFIPFLNKYALRFNLLDIPDTRKLHNYPKVRVGGISIFIAFLIGEIFLIFFTNLIEYVPNIRLFYFTLFVSTIFFLLGLLDDLIKLSPFIRLLVQVSIVSILWHFGFNLNGFILNSIPFLDVSYVILPLTICLLITIFWVVGIVNAINWIDGLDGLASGIGIIFSITLFFLITSAANNWILLIIFPLTGALIGFFIFNKYPSKLYMGDAGSYFVGSIIAITSLSLNFSLYDDSLNQVNLWDPLLSASILFLPLVDMISVISNRTLKGLSPFYPDQSHIHHKLLSYGISHKNSSEILLFIAFLFSLIAILIHYKFLDYIWYLFSIILGFGYLCFFTYNNK